MEPSFDMASVTPSSAFLFVEDSVSNGGAAAASSDAFTLPSEGGGTDSDLPSSTESAAS